jgi:hypothetical protein
MNDDRDLYSGMTRLHILHHANKELIFGAGMTEELARHGYKISPGTLYLCIRSFTGWRNVVICVRAKNDRERAFVAFTRLLVPGDVLSRWPSSVCENSLGS